VDRQPQKPEQQLGVQQQGQNVTLQSRHLCRLPELPAVYHHPLAYMQQLWPLLLPPIGSLEVQLT
jgi:hypothetical protein